MATAYSTTAPRLIGAYARPPYKARLLEDARRITMVYTRLARAEQREAGRGGASA